MSTKKRKSSHIFTSLLAIIWGLLPILLVLFTFLNLRFYKMEDTSMEPTLERGTYIISIRKDVEDLEKGTLIYIDTDDIDERTVRKFVSLDGNNAYVAGVNGENGEWISADDIWGTIWFQLG